MNIHAILFDLDGTLIDSAPGLGFAANKMRIDRKLSPYPLEQYRPWAGSGAAGMLKVAFNLVAEDDNYESLREEFYNNYETCMFEHINTFPGIIELLQTLDKSNTPWGIVTNKSERFTRPLLKTASWAQNAKALVGGDTTPFMKPHPAPVLEGARQLNIKPKHCLYVGDDLRDIQAGKAADMATAAATWGYLGIHSDYTNWQADHIANQPQELLNLLK